MVKYKIYKQLFPTSEYGNSPKWANHTIWVLKLNHNDKVEEFSLKREATARKKELEKSDPTNRKYKIEKIK